MRLLLGLIRKLPEADQDVVLALLLQGLTSNDAWQQAVRHGDEQWRLMPALIGQAQLRAGGQMSAAGQTRAAESIVHANLLAPTAQTRMLPVRFPAATHERLKDWGAEHNFPMAAVVRGLVERFLDSQQIP